MLHKSIIYIAEYETMLKFRDFKQLYRFVHDFLTIRLGSTKHFWSSLLGYSQLTCAESSTTITLALLTTDICSLRLLNLLYKRVKILSISGKHSTKVRANMQGSEIYRVKLLYYVGQNKSQSQPRFKD